MAKTGRSEEGALKRAGRKVRSGWRNMQQNLDYPDRVFVIVSAHSEITCEKRSGISCVKIFHIWKKFTLNH